jgi:hypothetical protein
MVKVICTGGGKEFEAIKTTKKYCSKECENENRRIKYAKNKELNKNNPKEEKVMPEKECLICGARFRPKNKSANQRSCCYSCMPDGEQLKRGDFLAKIKENRGGKCQRCGYNTCIKALEFHHLDPSQKDFTISNDHFKLKDAIEESKKCILICANCHRELHDNLWNISELNLEKKEEVE